MKDFVQYSQLYGMLPCMNLKLTRYDAGEGTHLTLMVDFTCVFHHVDPDTISCSTCVITDLTVVRLLICMFTYVNLKLTRCNK